MKHANLACLVLGSLLVIGTSAGAATGSQANDTHYKGLWLSTPYPAMTVSADEPVRLQVAVHNAGLPPLRADLSLADVPKGWKVAFVAKDRPVRAVFVSPDAEADVQLRVEPPKGVSAGIYHMELAARTPEQSFTLPVDLKVGEALPPELKASADFPALKGTPSSSFEYKLTLANESDREALVALTADTPSGFQVSFTERYGSQELTSIPVKAGGKQDLKAKVKLPDGIQAGIYQIAVNAVADGVDTHLPLKLEVTGQPKLDLSAPGGLLSGTANAGEETAIDLIVQNTGSAPARDVKLASFEPNGWKVDFKPAKLDVVQPDQPVKVKALITPSSKAIAGDYMVTLRSSGDGVSSSEKFRVTVETSTLWGIVGVLVIAASLVVLTLAVVRFGRR